MAAVETELNSDASRRSNAVRREGGELREEEREALPALAEWAVRAVTRPGCRAVEKFKSNIARCNRIY